MGESIQRINLYLNESIEQWRVGGDDTEVSDSVKILAGDVIGWGYDFPLSDDEKEYDLRLLLFLVDEGKTGGYPQI